MTTGDPLDPLGFSVTGRRQRANDLDGKTWTRYSLSIWSDIRKTREEIALGHPALFPQELVFRLLSIFLSGTGKTVLDPFAGSGSTVVAAARSGHRGIGLELSAEFVAMAKRRLSELYASVEPLLGEGEIWEADAHRLLEYVRPDSVDLVITSPPYWDVLSQRRSADHKPIRDYPHPLPPAGDDRDLSQVKEYDQFLDKLQTIFADVRTVLRPGAYCVVVVMDLRKGGRFYPFHSDLARHLQEAGLTFEDLVIWDRRQEYNRLRPLGYPSVFRVNKVHEYILIFRRPLQP
ncbi:MAG: site-specific DNA-methyltransferase [Limnochordaceae bacterium]|nr:site-specific DNA-methyltransferase [Limnochordaceae bacterium]